MDAEKEMESRLSQMETNWTRLMQAQMSGSDEARAAQNDLLQRYKMPIFRYLLKLTGSMDAAEELFQDFAVRFIRGDFENASPERGRFRFFLKRSLRNLLIDHRRKKGRFVPLGPQETEAAEVAQDVQQAEAEFTQACRADMLQRTWNTLDVADGDADKQLYVVLRVRSDHPDMRSPQLAEIISARLGKKVSAEWVRNRLHFARQKFTERLLNEIAKTLATPTLDEIEEEVTQLGLLDYCRDALKRRRNNG